MALHSSRRVPSANVQGVSSIPGEHATKLLPTVEQVGPHSGPRDLETGRDLLGRQSFDIVQQHDLALSRRQDLEGALELGEELALFHPSIGRLDAALDLSLPRVVG